MRRLSTQFIVAIRCDLIATRPRNQAAYWHSPLASVRR